MHNLYQTQEAKIISMKRESSDTMLFRLQFVDQKIQKQLAFLPGQFMQIGLAGWGECPISICSSSKDAKDFFELAIRQVGVLTTKLQELKIGDLVQIRGPFGNGFDISKFKDKPLILIGGGCGFIPLRPLIIDYLAGRLENTILQIFYGCLNEQTLLFKGDHANWSRYADLDIALEKPSAEWKGEKGLITNLIKNNKKITPNSVAVLVGPPKMYKFVIAELQKKKIKDENIYLSLERKMYCGAGVCQHCAIGPYYVCKDGPVFSWDQIKDVPEVI
jgi:NAD(P)H-flavin reductase